MTRWKVALHVHGMPGVFETSIEYEADFVCFEDGVLSLCNDAPVGSPADTDILVIAFAPDVWRSVCKAETV